MLTVCLARDPPRTGALIKTAPTSDARLSMDRPPLRVRRPKMSRRQGTANNETDSAPFDQMVVRATSGGWSLLVDDHPVPVWTVSTKKRAVKGAKLAADDLNCKLIIERKSGTVQAVHQPSA